MDETFWSTVSRAVPVQSRVGKRDFFGRKRDRYCHDMSAGREGKNLGLKLIFPIFNSGSVSFILAYLMQHKGQSLETAYNTVRQQKSDVYPNIGFWRQLIQFETDMFNEEKTQIITQDIQSSKSGIELLSNLATSYLATISNSKLRVANRCRHFFNQNFFNEKAKWKSENEKRSNSCGGYITLTLQRFILSLAFGNCCFLLI